MFNLSKHNVGKAVLASCLALEGVATTDTLSGDSVANVYAGQVDVTADHSSRAKNTLRSVLSVSGNGDSMTDFYTKHIPVFEIRHGSGVIAQRGSLNAWICHTIDEFSICSNKK